MSEEPEAQVEETEVTEEAPATEEKASNPLFDALFEAAEEPQQEEEQQEEMPVPSSLSEALYDIENEEPTEEAEEEEPQQEEPEAKEVGEPPEAARPKKKVKKVKQVIDPEVPKPEKVEETKVAFSQPEESEEDKIVKELIPEEKEYYELAKFASENMSEHKDLDKEFLGYFKKSNAYEEKRLKDDPYADLGDDHEYKEFMEKNRPKFTAQDAKKSSVHDYAGGGGCRSKGSSGS